MDGVLMNHLWILVNLEKVRAPQKTIIPYESYDMTEDDLDELSSLNCLWIPDKGLIIKIGS